MQFHMGLFFLTHAERTPTIRPGTGEKSPFLPPEDQGLPERGVCPQVQPGPHGSLCSYLILCEVEPGGQLGSALSYQIVLFCKHFLQLLQLLQGKHSPDPLLGSLRVLKVLPCGPVWGTPEAWAVSQLQT